MKTIEEWKEKLQVGTQFWQIWVHDVGEVENLCTVSSVQADGIWASCPGFSDGFMPFAKENRTIQFTEDGWMHLNNAEEKLAEYVWVEEEKQPTTKVIAKIHVYVVIEDTIEVDVPENITPKELGELLREEAKKKARSQKEIPIADGNINFPLVNTNGVDFSDDRHIEVEYDKNGDYSDFAYVPLTWIKFFGDDIEKAFECHTGHSKEDIIDYDEDTTDYHTADGGEYYKTFHLAEK